MWIKKSSDWTKQDSTYIYNTAIDTLEQTTSKSASTSNATLDTIEEKAWKILDENTKDLDGNNNDVSVPYDAAAQLAYQNSDKSMNYVDFKTKYEADAIADVISKQPSRLSSSSTTTTTTTTTSQPSKEIQDQIETIVKEALIEEPQAVKDVIQLDENDLVKAIETEANNLVEEMVEDLQEECEITDEGQPKDELCVDESKLSIMKTKLKKVVGRTLGFVRTGGGGSGTEAVEIDDDANGIDFDNEEIPEGELLEQGWEKRGNSNALRRNAEVWKFALKCVFKALKPRKLKKKSATEEEIKEAQTEAATFIRNGLLRLGPSFVKLVC